LEPKPRSPSALFRMGACSGPRTEDQYEETEDRETGINSLVAADLIRWAASLIRRDNI